MTAPCKGYCAPVFWLICISVFQIQGCGGGGDEEVQESCCRDAENKATEIAIAENQQNAAEPSWDQSYFPENSEEFCAAVEEVNACCSQEEIDKMMGTPTPKETYLNDMKMYRFSCTPCGKQRKKWQKAYRTMRQGWEDTEYSESENAAFTCDARPELEKVCTEEELEEMKWSCVERRVVVAYIGATPVRDTELDCTCVQNTAAP